MRLIYLSPVPWESFAQRSHKFVEWFHARTQGEVLWINPYPTRLPSWEDLRRPKITAAGYVKSPSWLKVIRPKALPVEPIPGSSVVHKWLWRSILSEAEQFYSKGCSLVIGKPSELALQILAGLPHIHAIYDAMDDFPAFYNGLARKAMARREHEVASHANKVWVSSTALIDRFAAHKSKLMLVPNACDAGVLPDIEFKPHGRPILGYVGTIGHWFDWSLVLALAHANPEVGIQLIGPVYSPPPSRLPRNIQLLPARDHASAIKAMQNFSVGLIPFKSIQLTASVDPIKYYEYRALGLPVISTRFGEMALREEQHGVFILAEEDDLVTLVNKAIDYRADQSEIQQFRDQNSWMARFDASGILNSNVFFTSANRH